MDLLFELGDWIYLKISPMKGVMKFGTNRKHIPRYVGPYDILKRVGKVAYQLKFPKEFALVHLMFHVSMFNKCMGDQSIVLLEGLGVK